MTDSNNLKNSHKIDESQDKLEKLKAGLFFTIITSFSVLTGFGYSLVATKKKETKEYPKVILKIKLSN